MNVKRYRNGDAEVEAVQWDGTDPRGTIIKWIRSIAGPGIANSTWGGMGWNFRIKSGDIYMQVLPGDYVVLDVDGEFFPMRPRLFDYAHVNADD